MNGTPNSPDIDAAEKWEVQLRKGTLELAILASLWNEPLYGLEILRNLESGSRLVVVEGTVYPLLTRLRSLGLLASEWVESDSGHPRKYYCLTDAGRSRALALSRVWLRFAGSMASVLTPLGDVARPEPILTKEPA
ncbi:MAG TPA: PadR family transcriptional regulator [Acidobacteriaceae bacterium]